MSAVEEAQDAQDAAPPMSTRRIPGLVVRGVCMGLAEVVPGVSGGTIAFVSGIYFELVDSLAKFGARSLTLLRSPVEFFAHHNLGFLLTLAAGMGAGILVFANLMHYLLDAAPAVVWAFFFGVIAMSVFTIGRARDKTNLVLFGGVGAICGLSLLFLPALSADASPLAIFLGGMVAVCAWLLPAISGSFVLLTLGLYEHVIAAVAQLDLVTLAVLAAGCATGLLIFARFLAWLMRRFHDRLLSLLTGFMLGSLVKLWPWRLEGTAGFAGLLGPADYAAKTGQGAMELGVVLAVLFGAISLWLLTRLDK